MAIAERHRRLVCALIPAALLLAACAGVSPGPSRTPGTASQLGPTASPTGLATTETPFSFPTCLNDPAGQHQAQDLEALLPDAVAQRPLASWSVRGRCALELVFEDVPGGIDALVSELESLGGSPIDIEQVAYAVAGRSNTVDDPPYFVNAVRRPVDEGEITVNLLTLLGGGGFSDLAAAIELEGFRAETIGGKEVFVGTREMLEQNVHQRGRPYLYQTEDTMFLVIADDEDWAREALANLP